MEEKTKKGWRSIEVNVASCINELDFLQRIEKEASKKLATTVGKVKKNLLKSLAGIKDKIKTIKIGLPETASLEIGLQSDTEDWAIVASELIDLFNLIDEYFLLYIDELPIFLYNILKKDKTHGIQRTRRFLDWFRNDIRSLPGKTKIKWLVSGSVGLDTLAQNHGMADTISTFHHYTLDAFEHEEAIKLLRCLAKNYKVQFTKEELKSIVELIRWPQPYYLQLYFNIFRSFKKEKEAASNLDLINDVLDSMTKHGSDNDFHHWEKRLHDQLPPNDVRHALSLLDQTSNTPKGTRAEHLLTYFHERVPNLTDEDAPREFIRLRDILIRDAYWQVDIINSVKYYSFCLEPLRRWWKRRSSL